MLIMLHQRVTEDKQYTKLMAILTSVNGGIAGVDALLGGWLAGNWGFRAVFWVMAIIAAAAIILVFLFAEESTAAETPAMDWLGALFLVVAMGTLITAINEMQKLAAANWTYAIILIVISAALLYRFLADREAQERSNGLHLLYEAAPHLGSAYYHHFDHDRCIRSDERYRSSYCSRS